MNFRSTLSMLLTNVQQQLFPVVEKHVGELTLQYKKLISILEVVKIEEALPCTRFNLGRPSVVRSCIARAYIAKIFLKIIHTKQLITALNENPRLRVICGWDAISKIPSESTFSRAFDELSLNISLCEKYGVPIRGVILNRVLDDKRDMILEYFPKALKQWNIPLIGAIPFNEFLNTPAIKDFETLFNTTLISGERHRYRHFQHSRLVAGSVESYESDIIPNELIITPASREDIIRTTLEKQKNSLEKGIDYQGGMILTSRHAPSPEIIQYIRKFDVPVLYAPLYSYDAMKMITSFIAKIRTEDTLKVEKAIKLVENNIDFDLLVSS